MLRTRTLERRIWGSYLAALAVSFVALLFLCRYVQNLADAELRAIRETELGNNLRHSLWWLDSKLSPSLASLSHQPFQKLQLEIDSDRVLTLPDAALNLPISSATIDDASQREPEAIAQVQQNNSRYRTDLRAEYSRVRGIIGIPSGTDQSLQNANEPQTPGSIALPPTQAVREFNQRNLNNFFSNGISINSQTSPFVPIWRGEELLLVRQQSPKSESLEVLTLDWPRLQQMLQKEISPYLPSAKIEPVAQPDTNMANQLASLPLRLLPGNELPPISPTDATPKRQQSIGKNFVLSAIWGGWLISIVAVGLLIAGALYLMNKRSMFVAAMTHELRTPLTTLRLYTDMLRDGMVTEKTKQIEYLLSLSHEVTRIEHLVENVFTFARLERTNRSIALEDHFVSEIIQRITPRLQDRCLQDGFELVTQIEISEQEQARLNSFCLEQILSNLIDNACKYGDRTANNNVLLIASKSESQRVSITIRNFGPGFDVRAPKFRAFSKTVEQAAMTAPGIGLGLAICRDLAVQMNATLEISNWEGGGSVQLQLQSSC